MPVRFRLVSPVLPVALLASRQLSWAVLLTKAQLAPSSDKPAPDRGTWRARRVGHVV